MMESASHFMGHIMSPLGFAFSIHFLSSYYLRCLSGINPIGISFVHQNSNFSYGGLPKDSQVPNFNLVHRINVVPFSLHPLCQLEPITSTHVLLSCNKANQVLNKLYSNLTKSPKPDQPTTATKPDIPPTPLQRNTQRRTSRISANQEHRVCGQTKINWLPQKTQVQIAEKTSSNQYSSSPYFAGNISNYKKENVLIATPKVQII